MNALRMLPVCMDTGAIAITVLGLVAVGGLGALLGMLVYEIEARRRPAPRRRSHVELARREEDVREERAVQDLILASMQEGVLLLDPDLRTAFANDALELHLGSRPVSASQLFLLDLREAVRQVAASSAPITVEVERSARLAGCA